MTPPVYVTAQDFIDAFPERWWQLLNAEEDDTDPDLTALNTAVSSANSMIAAHIKDRYALTLSPVPALLVRIGVRLIYGMLLEGRSDVAGDEMVTDPQYRRAVEELEDIRRGRVVLDVADADQRKLVAGAVTAPLMTEATQHIKQVTTNNPWFRGY